MDLHFIKKNGRAYYYNSIKDFLNDNPLEILGNLEENADDNGQLQKEAWENQINNLKSELRANNAVGDIIFEYDIIRLGKRVDVILLLNNIVFSLEYKNGKKIFERKDAIQAEDYALDLKNFHKESEGLYVCPILIATDAGEKKNIISCYEDKEIYLQYANASNFYEVIKSIVSNYGSENTIDFDRWFNSPYYPTPTIIDAAVDAYNNIDISEIANSEAGSENIAKCQSEIEKIIDFSKNNKRKSICFITGVPGAGKTLVGLNIACGDKNHNAVYISGNGPLVSVLRESIARNISKRGITKTKANSVVVKMIQGIHEFRKDCINNIDNKDCAPFENTVVFDEAQRCWDSEKMKDWTSKKASVVINESEPHFLISSMNKKKDWAVIICLVGLGQDIYNGEVGINEWFGSVITDFTNWDIYYSSEIFNQLEDKKINKDLIISCKQAHSVEGLHLKTSVRSFRSNKVSEFVDYLLVKDPISASNTLSQLKNKYPVFITRDLKLARKWAWSKTRGGEKCGLIASSGARRLIPEGVFVPKDLDVVNWFLSPSIDPRSSNALELAASEFKIQGLEIDWGIVCWAGDLRPADNGWGYYTFRNTNWQKRRNLRQINYLINSYRVLLTRCRQGMVIYIPIGEDGNIDPTREKGKIYDPIYNYLKKEVGITELPHSNYENKETQNMPLKI